MKLTKLGEPTPRHEPLSIAGICYPIEEIIRLPTPEVSSNYEFFQVIDRRTSKRNYIALTIEQTSNLLWYSAGLRSERRVLSGAGCWSHTPTPSAGGCHPIDIFVMSNNLNPNAIYLYDSGTHALGKIATQNVSCLAQLWQTAMRVVPTLGGASLLWFVAQPARTLARYINGESLIWRDSGALAATICLVAEALDLNACILGVSGEPILSCVLDPDGEPDQHHVLGVGGCLVGARQL